MKLAQRVDLNISYHMQKKELYEMIHVLTYCDNRNTYVYQILHYIPSIYTMFYVD